MYESIIIGAGPAGISMAAEAIKSGLSKDKVLVLEKFEGHSWAIKKFYPEEKLVTANYKGQEAVCHGVMCLTDTTKQGALTYIDQAIESFGISVNYNEEVLAINRDNQGYFIIETNKTSYVSKTCVIAIGILGRPNKPSYSLPSSLKNDLLFDITSQEVKNKNVLVVGGGDSASEYAQYLVQGKNKVTLSYRKSEFSKMNPINKKSILALGEQGSVTLLMESDIEKVEDLDGSPNIVFKDGEQKKYDKVIYALGGSTPTNFLSLLGINFEGGNAVIDKGFETSVPGMFLIGDLSSGKKGGSIVSAFNSSHKAMMSVCRNYLDCKLE
jgi:thioredoxin reductase (NADPH)